MQCIKDLSYEELGLYLESVGQPPYRRDQIWDWLYRKHAETFEQMTNLGKDQRAGLAARFSASACALDTCLESRIDKTAKFLQKLSDGQKVETVWIPLPDHAAVCLSTQVGCKVGCAFCLSGSAGLVRSLSAGEILDQFVTVLRSGRAASHVVFMGIGEPLDNFDALTRAIRVINSPKAFNIGARRITVSTAGIPEKIEALCDLDIQIELAVSLHAAEDALRDRLVPLNRRHPIGEILGACRRYIERTNRQVTFEYVMIAGVNDGDEHARALGQLLGRMLCKVNIIPFNPHPACDFRAPARDRVRAFSRLLEAYGLPVTVRVSRGQDILAACGQLRLNADQPLPSRPAAAPEPEKEKTAPVRRAASGKPADKRKPAGKTETKKTGKRPTAGSRNKPRRGI